MNNICILLSLYKPDKKFLKEFLESLDNQTEKNFDLIVRIDEESSDYNLIHNLVRGVILQDRTSIGVNSSYSELLGYAIARDYKYIMFADQDDVWLPEKIEKTLSTMYSNEEKFGKEMPLLVHTDLMVVNENLRLISCSFWRYQNLNPAQKRPRHFLMQNNVTGCTLMINNALGRMVYPIPEEARVHDWWIALVAGFFGTVIYLPEQTILYRQHNRNTIGAVKFGFFKGVRKFLTSNAGVNPENFMQARKLLEYFEKTMSSQNKNLIENYILLSNSAKIKKWYLILRYRFFKQGFYRNIALFLKI